VLAGISNVCRTAPIRACPSAAAAWPEPDRPPGPVGPTGLHDLEGWKAREIALSCAKARDLACDLLDAELTPSGWWMTMWRVSQLPQPLPALVAVHRELARLRQKMEAVDGEGAA
jgi:hypothetical protein